MEVIEGGGDSRAHLQRRMLPFCDLCGVELKGRMPNPFWAARSDQRDDQGHPAPGAAVRLYLCKQHRESMAKAIDSAWQRETHRTVSGQRMFPSLPHLHGLDSD